MPISAAGVHRPARLGVERRHVAARALRLAVEDAPPALRRRRVERALRRRRRRDRELVEVQRGELRRDQIASVPHVVEARSRAATGNCVGSSRPRVEERALAVHLRVRDVGVPVRRPSPSPCTCAGSRRRGRRRPGAASPRSSRRAGTPCRRGSAPRRNLPGPQLCSTFRTVASSTRAGRERLEVGRHARRSRRRRGRGSASRRAGGRCPPRTSRRRSSGRARR